MIGIITVSCWGNIAEIFVAGWETWMIPVMFIGSIVLWVLHVSQKSDMNTRTNIAFAIAAFLVFFHGIHEISYFDVSIVTLILLATFTLVDRIILLNLILLEYARIFSQISLMS